MALPKPQTGFHAVLQQLKAAGQGQSAEGGETGLCVSFRLLGGMGWTGKAWRQAARPPLNAVFAKRSHPDRRRTPKGRGQHTGADYCESGPNSVVVRPLSMAGIRTGLLPPFRGPGPHLAFCFLVIMATVQCLPNCAIMLLCAAGTGPQWHH